MGRLVRHHQSKQDRICHLAKRLTAPTSIHYFQNASVASYNLCHSGTQGSTKVNLARYIEHPIRRKGPHAVGVIRGWYGSKRQSCKASPRMSAGHLLLTGACDRSERVLSLHGCRRLVTPKAPKKGKRVIVLGSGSARIQLQRHDASADHAADAAGPIVLSSL